MRWIIIKSPLKRIADYPSIGQVNYLARKHNVHVIWAVTEDKFGLYRELAKMVEGSSAGVISRDGRAKSFILFCMFILSNICKEIITSIPFETDFGFTSTCESGVQGSAKRRAQGLVTFFTAVA